MAGQPPAMQKLIDKINNSRDFIISLVIHVILVAVLGGVVFFKVVQEPSDFEGGSEGFVQPNNTPQTPQPQNAPAQPPAFNVATINSANAQVDSITTTSETPLDFNVSSVTAPPAMTAPVAPAAAVPTAPKSVGGDGAMPTEVASQIKAFSSGWGKGAGPGTGLRSREFQFTAYIGQYSGGDWNSTMRLIGGVTEGSLPNLLYFMSLWSKDKIKTNYKQVQAIKLDSDDLFKIKPPFIFLTGTKDFKLTDREVDNLQKYVRIGGCIWGDSSVPGLHSGFDLAFRREMKRVIPDVDKDFEPLPENHPIFTQTYFPEVNRVPAGLNYYRLPVYAMKIYGEVAILYTANDYGDMWQTGLDKDGQIDMRRDAHKALIAVNRALLFQNYIYVRNLNPPALAATYKFGTNVVVHLLTRWENKVQSAPSL